MKKILAITALCTSLLIGSQQTFAQDMQKGFMARPTQGYEFKKPDEAQRKAEMERRRAEIDKRLGVTEEQKAQLKTIHEKAKVEISPKIRQLTEVEHEISVIERQNLNKERYNINTLQDVKLSGKSLEQLKSEQKTLKDEIRKIKKDQFEESQKVFTDEQKKELDKMRQEHEQKMKANRGHRPPMPPRY